MALLSSALLSVGEFLARCSSGHEAICHSAGSQEAIQAIWDALSQHVVAAYTGDKLARPVSSGTAQPRIAGGLEISVLTACRLRVLLVLCAFVFVAVHGWMQLHGMLIYWPLSLSKGPQHSALGNDNLRRS